MNTKIKKENQLRQSVKNMIQYLVILLDDTSVTFCHYNNIRKVRNLMTTDTLKAGILYGMKENLNIQFVYPDYELPKEYNDLIETTDHIKIKPISISHNASVIVANGLEEAKKLKEQSDIAYVLRLCKNELFNNADSISQLIEKIDRLNIVLTDIDKFKECDFENYKKTLSDLSISIEQEYIKGRSPQLNILTDRMMLDTMNNCGAGDSTITLAPNGMFYVCPAFYQAENGFAIGNLQDGLNIKNSYMYKLDCAPLCRTCDAYQCRRCIWLNHHTTLEINTPSHEQCVIAHHERNASRNLLIAIHKHCTFLSDKPDIKKIDYLDPFEIHEEW